MPSFSVAKNLIVYGAAHGIVDLASAAAVYNISRTGLVSADVFFLFILAYDFLAFAGQAVLGFLVDYFRAPRIAAISGCALVIAGNLLWLFSPLAAVILVGLGNALFHLGGGAIGLNLTPGRATAPGLFVAPGAIGLTVGIAAGKQGNLGPFFIIALLLLSVFAMYFVKPPAMNYGKKKPPVGKKAAVAIFVLLFSSIAVRALVASIAVYPWKKDVTLLWIFVLAVAAGKALGGVFADKFGWIRVSVSALLLSAFIVPLGGQTPAAGIAGMFLFQFVMAVALVALALLIPGRPALVFGLNCLSLFIGIFPLFFADFALKTMGPNWQAISFWLTIYASVALYFALSLLLKRGKKDVKVLV